MVAQACEAKRPPLKILEEKIGYNFVCQNLLEDALCHPSLGGRSFERMEFLGDRFLGAAISQELYKTYPQAPEGELTRRLAFLVSRPRLFQVALSLDLESYILRDKKNDSARMTILADSCEALIGALYLDLKDFHKLCMIVCRWWAPLLADQNTTLVDAKSALQEYLQQRGRALPVYRLCEENGPSHCPFFKIIVELDQGESFMGESGTKKSAQQQAAEKALSFLIQQQPRDPS